MSGKKKISTTKPDKLPLGDTPQTNIRESPIRDDHQKASDNGLPVWFVNSKLKDKKFPLKELRGIKTTNPKELDIDSFLDRIYEQRPGMLFKYMPETTFLTFIASRVDSLIAKYVLITIGMGLNNEVLKTPPGEDFEPVRMEIKINGGSNYSGLFGDKRVYDQVYTTSLDRKKKQITIRFFDIEDFASNLAQFISYNKQTNNEFDVVPWNGALIALSKYVQRYFLRRTQSLEDIVADGFVSNYGGNPEDNLMDAMNEYGKITGIYDYIESRISQEPIVDIVGDIPIFINSLTFMAYGIYANPLLSLPENKRFPSVNDFESDGTLDKDVREKLRKWNPERQQGVLGYASFFARRLRVKGRYEYIPEYKQPRFMISKVFVTLSSMPRYPNTAFQSENIPGPPEYYNDDYPSILEFDLSYDVVWDDSMAKTSFGSIKKGRPSLKISDSHKEDLSNDLLIDFHYSLKPIYIGPLKDHFDLDPKAWKRRYDSFGTISRYPDLARSLLKFEPWDESILKNELATDPSGFENGKIEAYRIQTLENLNVYGYANKSGNPNDDKPYQPLELLKDLKYNQDVQDPYEEQEDFIDKVKKTCQNNKTIGTWCGQDKDRFYYTYYDKRYSVPLITFEKKPESNPEFLPSVDQVSYDDLINATELPFPRFPKQIVEIVPPVVNKAQSVRFKGPDASPPTIPSKPEPERPVGSPPSIPSKSILATNKGKNNTASKESNSEVVVTDIPIANGPYPVSVYMKNVFDNWLEKNPDANKIKTQMDKLADQAHTLYVDDKSKLASIGNVQYLDGTNAFKSKDSILPTLTFYYQDPNTVPTSALMSVPYLREDPSAPVVSKI